jgi:hypothetical protein
LTTILVDEVLVVLSIPVAVIEYVLFDLTGPTDTEPDVVTPVKPLVVTLTALVVTQDNVTFELQLTTDGVAVRVTVGLLISLVETDQFAVVEFGEGILLFAVNVTVVDLVSLKAPAVIKTVQATPGRTKRLFPVVPLTFKYEFGFDVFTITLQSLS